MTDTLKHRIKKDKNGKNMLIVIINDLEDLTFDKFKNFKTFDFERYILIGFEKDGLKMMQGMIRYEIENRKESLFKEMREFFESQLKNLKIVFD